MDDSNHRRIDEYWHAISNIRNENGSRKYDKLWTLVKCVMLISHGNADPEREFSINKHILSIHGPTTGEHTIESIRLVKEFVMKFGGSEKVPVTKWLLQSCKQAYSKYEKDREKKYKFEGSCSFENSGGGSCCNCCYE